MNVSEMVPGTIASGTMTQFGVVDRSTDTGYIMRDGSFVAFRRIHGTPAFVEPLVVFGGSF
jgi:hypothetical protein